MAVIVLRSTKGSPLTFAEADANFSNINTEVGLKLNTSSYTAADVLTKIKTVDGVGSGLDADLLDGLASATANTVSTIVARDASGNFSAGTITATLTGNVTGNVTGNLTGTVTGNATNVTGIVGIANGGTGASTAALARTGLGLGTLATQASTSVSITGGTITGITDLTVADGGTGASTATQARTNLGLVLGVDVQPFNNQLTALSAVLTDGFLVRTGTGTATSRSITGGTGITITNGDGDAGNPLISLSANLVSLSGITPGTSGNLLISNGTNWTSSATPGTSGNVLTSNGTNWTSATPAVIGVGQTWQTVVRSTGVTYTNSTGKPIFISIGGSTTTNAQGGGYVGVIIGGISIPGNWGHTGAVPVRAYGLVGVGQTYSYTSVGVGSLVYVELR
jgi:hypothetical protein